MRIAYVAADGQIRVVRPDGEGDAAVTFPEGAGGGWGALASAEARSWPCWSPDGRWLACFLHPEGEDAGGPAVVSAVEVDGVEERQLVQLTGQLPVYCQWSPAGDRLAVLSQLEDELQLSVARLEHVGERRVVDEGVPMFFSWTGDGRRLLVHAGSRRDPRGRLVLRDWGPDGHDSVFPGEPGSFCTPLQIGGRVVYGAAVDGGTTVCVAQVDGADCRELITLKGLLAIVSSPDGERLAVGNAPGGESTPYQGLWIVPLDGSEPLRLTEAPCLSFHWVPGGERIIVSAWDPGRAALTWRLYTVETGEHVLLDAFLPTRDQLFLLHFFEQFALSHPLVSADGRWFTYATHPLPRHGGDGAPHVVVVDLERPEEGPRQLALGSFAVFSPSPPA